MALYSIIIILLTLSIALLAVAPKVKVPTSLFLMLGGIGIGFIPVFNDISINPEVIFLIFLPPMLFNDAFNLSFNDFKNNLRTISILSIALVFTTIIGIAIVAYYLVPGISWPLAFALGAILSPTDAIAASSSLRGIKISCRAKTIIESESLVNDASALIGFRFATAAIAGATFVFWQASLQFFITLIGGCLVGYGVWFIFCIVLKKVRLNHTLAVSLNLLVPFVAYLIGDELKVSGVMAVVTSGLFISYNKRKIFTEETKKQAEAIWDVIIFLLNALVFILIGLQFAHAVLRIHESHYWLLIGISFLIFLTALAIRMMVIFMHKLKLDRDVASIKKRHIKGHDRKHRLGNIEPLNWKDSVLIGWAGMRGIVSLATAMALPLVTGNGDALRGRSMIIFITVVVVLIMLVIQGIGLPILVKLLKIKDPVECEEWKKTEV